MFKHQNSEAVTDLIARSLIQIADRQAAHFLHVLGNFFRVCFRGKPLDKQSSKAEVIEL